MIQYSTITIKIPYIPGQLVNPNPYYDAYLPLCLDVYIAHLLCCRSSKWWSCMIYCFSAAGTPFSSCCIPWEWLGSCWLSMQRCHTCRRQACTLSPSPTSTTSPSTTIPSLSSSWSPTFPVSQQADVPYFQGMVKGKRKCTEVHCSPQRKLN